MSIEENIPNTDTAPPPEPEAVPETAHPVSDPGAPEAAAAAETEAEAAAEAAPSEAVVRPRRRVLRTVGLIAVAAVLGIVGGTAVGYGIQAQREPTPLPPLNQPALAYPKPLPKGQEPDPLPASEDRQAKAQGDLRKLLVPKPAGAKKDEFGDPDGWMSVQQFASDFERAGEALSYQLELGIRRVAVTSWKTGENRLSSVRLVQYRPGDELGAKDHVEDQQGYMPEEEYANGEGEVLKGSADGRYYVFPVQRKAGYLDFYEARALFHRGDIAVEIFIFDTKKITEKDIRSLAEQQLGRL